MFFTIVLLINLHYGYNFFFIYNKVHTLQKREVCAQLFDPHKSLAINSSQFAIFIEKDNPSSFFRFSFWVILPYECPGPCRVDMTRAFIRWKCKIAQNEKQKILHGFSFSINIANFGGSKSWAQTSLFWSVSRFYFQNNLGEKF